LKELPWPRGLEVTLGVAGSICKKMEVEALGASRAAVLLPKVSQTLICSSIFMLSINAGASLRSISK
tara:strand:+ start:424 stop:624 length:201 start_codon:yes stop_codon:yes gene_type:complete